MNNLFLTPESPTPPIRANEWGLKLPSRDSFFRTSVTAYPSKSTTGYISPAPPPSPSPSVVPRQGNQLSVVLHTPSPKARSPPLTIPSNSGAVRSKFAAPIKAVPSATTLPTSTPVVPSQSGAAAQEQIDKVHRVERPASTLWEKRWMRHPFGRPNAPLSPKEEPHNPRPELPPIGQVPYLSYFRANDERLRKIRSSHVISEQRRRESINVGFERLKSLLPFGDYVDGMTKAQILQHAADYIIKLERSIEVLARDED